MRFEKQRDYEVNSCLPNLNLFDRRDNSNVYLLSKIEFNSEKLYQIKEECYKFLKEREDEKMKRGVVSLWV